MANDEEITGPFYHGTKADLRPGDILLEIDRKPVKDLKTFTVQLQEYQPGDTLLFLVFRRGSTLYLTLTIWKKE